MIHTSSSFNDSSWDNKILREILLIPEDHLKFLNSLPEWSGLTTDVVNKQSDVNSHCSQLDSQIPPTKLPENLQLNFRSFGLLSNQQKYQDETIETSTIGIKKRHRSSSAIDTCKFRKHLPCSNLLKRTLSTSDIHLVVKQFEESSYLKVGSILNNTSILSNISQNSIKENSFEILNKESLKSLNTNENIPDGIKNKEILPDSKSSEQMEVISEAPIANTENKVIEVEFAIMQRKQDVSQQLKICTPTSEDCDHTKQVNNIDIESNKCDSGYNAHSKISDNSVLKNNEINLSSQKISGVHNHIAEKADISKISIETFGNEKHILSDNNYKSNESNINKNFQGVDIKENQKSCPSAFSLSVETTSFASVKRKAEMKRSSKKHKGIQEKNKHARNIKRAEKITYSREQLKSMLEILQQFFV